MAKHHGKRWARLGIAGVGLCVGVGCAVAPAPEGERATGAAPAPLSPADAGGGQSCNRLDAYEKNNGSDDSAALDYQSVSTWEEDEWTWDPVTGTWGSAPVTQFHASVGSTDATLCHKDEDWYLVSTAALASLYGAGQVHVRVRAMAAGATWCSPTGIPEIDDELALYDPPAGPEHTLTVEMYDATTLELLGTGTSDVGRVWLTLGGPAYGHDLLLRFVGPKQADYDYSFFVWTQSYDGEDECEF